MADLMALRPELQQGVAVISQQRQKKISITRQASLPQKYVYIPQIRLAKHAFEKTQCLSRLHHVKIPLKIC